MDDNVPRQRMAGADDRSFGELVTQVSENVSLLVREEIELAKAEVEQKVKVMARGAIAAAIAGFLGLLALIFLFHGAAWGLNEVLNSFWAGFLIVFAILLGLAGLGGWLAMRSFKTAAPPTPDQAIEEARLIREAIEHPEVQAAMTSPKSRKEVD